MVSRDRGRGAGGSAGISPRALYRVPDSDRFLLSVGVDRFVMAGSGAECGAAVVAGADYFGAAGAGRCAGEAERGGDHGARIV